MTAQVFACRLCGAELVLPATPTRADVLILDMRMGWHAVHRHEGEDW